MTTPAANGASRIRTRVPNPNFTRSTKIGSGAELIFSPSGQAALKSVNSQIIEDPFSPNYTSVQGELAVIQPPFNLNALQNLPRENSMLLQCIDAMVTNTEGHGWRLEYVGPEGQQDSPEAQAEKRRLTTFLLHPNPDCSFDETRARLRRDLETMGNSAFEALRLPGTGEIVVMTHIPFATLRMTAKDKVATPITVEVAQDDGTTVKLVMRKKFRRFVQRSGTSVTYFKEFGDPRSIRADNGEVDDSCPEEMRATEIFHSTLYSPGTVYGVPRWINQLPAILGSRQAELTNLDFFRENAVPALAVLVSGGRLTSNSVDSIEDHLSGVRGRKSMNRIVVLEALGDDHAASEEGTIPPPRVDIKPLAGERQKEGFFLEYGGDCDKKIRSSFRIPPIFVGQSEDYTHATAKSSYEVGEGQVFGPARRTSDDVVNTHVLQTYKPKYWELRSNPPKITDPEEVIKAITAFSELGAMSPNQVIDMANEYFDLELEKIAEEWGNFPFSIVEALVTKGTLKGLEEIEDTTKITPPPALAGAPGTVPNVPGVAEPKAPIAGSDAAKLAEAFEVIKMAITGPLMVTNPDRVDAIDAIEPDPAVVEQHV